MPENLATLYQRAALIWQSTQANFRQAGARESSGSETPTLAKPVGANWQR